MMEMMSIDKRVDAQIVSFDGKIGLYVNDFKGNIIEKNADEEFETASCVKVFVLTELFRRLHEGTVALDQKLPYRKNNYIDGSGILRSLSEGLELSLIDYATLMIIVSDNIATNILIEFLGVDRINETIESFGLKQSKLHNKIDFDKYDKLGTSTPREYAKIFELAYKKKLYSEEISDKFIEILKMQHYNTMMTKDIAPYYLDSEDTGDEELIYFVTKSGSMNACRNDGGLVYTPFGGYAISIFTKEFYDPLYHNNHESYQFGSKVSNLILNHYLSLKGSIE
jgi:beta-lactamase class A